MKAFLWATGVIVLLLLFLLWIFWPGHGTPPDAKGEAENSAKVQNMERISPEEAVRLARKEIQDKVDIPSGVEPVVVLDKDAMQYTVTFPTNLPKGTKGADYHAQIVVDAKTGKVVQVLAGS